MSCDKFVGMKRTDPQTEAIRIKTFGEMKEQIVSVCLERLKEKGATDERKPWECPRCHKINAPHVDRCDCQGEVPECEKAYKEALDFQSENWSKAISDAMAALIASNQKLTL